MFYFPRSFIWMIFLIEGYKIYLITKGEGLDYFRRAAPDQLSKSSRRRYTEGGKEQARSKIAE